jgi:hypothetical protein
MLPRPSEADAHSVNLGTPPSLSCTVSAWLCNYEFPDCETCEISVAQLLLLDYSDMSVVVLIQLGLLR